MTTQQMTLLDEPTLNQPVLYMAIELSNKQWKIVFSDGSKRRRVTVQAGNLAELERAVKTSQERFGGVERRVISCYEAGRDGFWLHRWLLAHGIENRVVDAASIEVSRRQRRVKTDRVDADKLLALLQRAYGGERDVWSEVTVPSVEAEDDRRLQRELERLKKERTGHRNRVQGILVGQGVRLELKPDFLTQVEQVVLWDGRSLSPELKAEVQREWERLQVVEQQIAKLERTQQERVATAPVGSPLELVQRLSQLGGIGITSAWIFVMEFFGWRTFHNRREVAGLAGLTGTPYASGEMQRDQGISKAGNRRVRALIVEIAWCWLKYQPQSKLSRWFQQRSGGGGKRQRRVGIVALARRLLIALWRYVADGVIPDGAHLKAA